MTEFKPVKAFLQVSALTAYRRWGNISHSDYTPFYSTEVLSITDSSVLRKQCKAAKMQL